MENKIEIERLDQIKPKDLDRLARENAETFVRKDRLKTHQLRNVFSAIEKMRTQFKQKETYTDELEMELILLKPKIAYAAGRQRSVRYHFFPFIESAIGAVESSGNKEKAMKNFFALMESVVGYHKYFESA